MARKATIGTWSCLQHVNMLRPHLIFVYFCVFLSWTSVCEQKIPWGFTPGRPEVLPLGAQLDDAGFDRQRSLEQLGEVGFFTRVACSMQGLTYTRPEAKKLRLEQLRLVHHRCYVENTVLPGPRASGPSWKAPRRCASWTPCSVGTRSVAVHRELVDCWPFAGPSSCSMSLGDGCHVSGGFWRLFFVVVCLTDISRVAAIYPATWWQSSCLLGTLHRDIGSEALPRWQSGHLSVGSLNDKPAWCTEGKRYALYTNVALKKKGTVELLNCSKIVCSNFCWFLSITKPDKCNNHNPVLADLDFYLLNQNAKNFNIPHQTNIFLHMP